MRERTSFVSSVWTPWYSFDVISGDDLEWLVSGLHARADQSRLSTGFVSGLRMWIPILCFRPLIDSSIGWKAELEINLNQPNESYEVNCTEATLRCRSRTRKSKLSTVPSIWNNCVKKLAWTGTKCSWRMPTSKMNLDEMTWTVSFILSASRLSIPSTPSEWSSRAEVHEIHVNSHRRRENKGKPLRSHDSSLDISLPVSPATNLDKARPSLNVVWRV